VRGLTNAHSFVTTVLVCASFCALLLFVVIARPFLGFRQWVAGRYRLCWPALRGKGGLPLRGRDASALFRIFCSVTRLPGHYLDPSSTQRLSSGAVSSLTWGSQQRAFTPEEARLPASRRSVHSGHHARPLGEVLLARLRAMARPGTPRPTTHLFIAGPNAFAFFLGQNQPAMRPVIVYEWDFEGERDGTYRLGLRVPPEPAASV
jgi:hypothetical protein